MKGTNDKKSKKAAQDPGLDKEKAKLDKFDPRGVQTLFRTLSRNHYNLLRMADNKASIVLTINSIIISLLMGVMYIAPDEMKETFRTMSRILVNFSMVSMVFALISMLPHKYLGGQFKSSKYKGSLYAANFSDQSLEEFKSEIKRVMQNGNVLYEEMTADIYFLGRAIAGKQKMLLLSVLVFLVGLISTIVYSAVNQVQF